MVVERTADTIGLVLVEAVHPDVARRERPVTELRPCGELECFVAVVPGPPSDLLEGGSGIQAVRNPSFTL